MLLIAVAILAAMYGFCWLVLAAGVTANVRYTE